MTIDWNPRPHVQHAWGDAKTVYGKISLVLFYSFIWVAIVTSTWQALFPLSMGGKCMVDGLLLKKDGQALTVALARGVHVLWIGFLSYADVGGFKVKNIAMVTIVVTVYTFCFVPAVKIGQELGCISCLWQMWIWLAWPILALLFAIVDDKMEDRGTREENQNLTV